MSFSNNIKCNRNINDEESSRQPTKKFEMKMSTAIIKENTEPSPFPPPPASPKIASIQVRCPARGATHRPP